MIDTIVRPKIFYRGRCMLNWINRRVVKYNPSNRDFIFKEELADRIVKVKRKKKLCKGCGRTLDSRSTISVCRPCKIEKNGGG